MCKDECTILVCSCDNYSDTWPAFFELFEKYWPDCPYDIVLNTESKSYCSNIFNVKCYQFYGEGDKVPYGKRLLKHLSTIKTDYIILLMDDFFLRSRVDSTRVGECLEELKKNSDIAVFSFDSIIDSLNIDDGKYSDFVLRPRYAEYKMNFQGAVWNKYKLISLIREHESPWELEIKGTFRSYLSNDRFYTLKNIEKTPINYGKKKGLSWGIVRGKWVYDDVVPLFELHGIKVDYSERGFFDVEDSRNIPIASKKSIGRDIASYGFFFWVRISVFRIIRIIRKQINLPYDTDYIAYKRRMLEKRNTYSGKNGQE